MKIRPEFPLQIFFDGACIVCATEVEHYLRREKNGRLQGVDISSSEFDAGVYGIPLSEFMHELHALDSGGRWYRGVDAFRAIWQAFPPGSIYGCMGWSISLPVVNMCARLMYRGFAAIRRYLPKRGSCDSGSCRLGK